MSSFNINDFVASLTPEQVAALQAGIKLPDSFGGPPIGPPVKTSLGAPSLIPNSALRDVPGTPLFDALKSDIQSIPPNLGVIKTFNQYLNLSTPGLNILPTPQTLNDFINGWVNFAKSQGFTFKSGAGSGLLQGLANAYAISMGIKLEGSSISTSTGDWSILFTPPPANIDTTLTSTSGPLAQAFNKFLQLGAAQLFLPAPLSGDPNPVESFFSQFDNFFAPTALLQSPDKAFVNPGVSANAYANLASFEQVFAALGPPDPTGQIFQAKLKEFVTDAINKDGVFIPSQSLAAWGQQLIQERNQVLPVGTPDLGTDSEKALVFNRILSLLIKLIGTIQTSAIAQANILKFETQFQNFYTGLQTQVPVFLKGDNNPLGADSTNAAQLRNDLNSSFNPQIIDNLRSLRGIHEDRAKQIQTRINQSNDAVNQQTDIVSSFLQQLTALLNTILH